MRNLEWIMSKGIKLLNPSLAQLDTYQNFIDNQRLIVVFTF
jgi:hypothetical protein